MSMVRTFSVATRWFAFAIEHRGPGRLASKLWCWPPGVRNQCARACERCSVSFRTRLGNLWEEEALVTHPTVPSRGSRALLIRT